MPLDLPVQNAIDRRAGYPEFFLRIPVPGEKVVLLDPPGGAFGAMPDDPPPFRAVRSGPVATGGPVASALGALLGI